MKLYDNYFDETMDLKSLKEHFVTIKNSNPSGHAANFTEELRDILTATVRKENDLSIIGLTLPETYGMIKRLEA